MKHSPFRGHYLPKRCKSLMKTFCVFPQTWLSVSSPRLHFTKLFYNTSFGLSATNRSPSGSKVRVGTELKEYPVENLAGCQQHLESQFDKHILFITSYPTKGTRSWGKSPQVVHRNLTTYKRTTSNTQCNATEINNFCLFITM